MSFAAVLSVPGIAMAETSPPKPIEDISAPPAVVADELKQEAQVSATGLFTAGNVSSLASGAGAFYEARLGRHGARVEAAGGLTGIATDTDADPANGFEEPLTDQLHTNGQLKLRYDFFFSPDDSGYMSLLNRHDSAANLAYRLRGEAGYRRYVLNQDKHSLSAEVGLVYAIDAAPFDGDTNHNNVVDLHDKVRFEETGGLVGARLMLAYKNALTEILAFTQMVEVIPNIWPELEAPFEAARETGDGDNLLGFGQATMVAATSALNLTLAENLALGLSLAFLYDNGAIARRNAYTNYDLATNLVLTYRLF